MTIDTSGKWWTGSEPNDIDEYLKEYTSDAYPTDEFRLCRCRCNCETFKLWADDDAGVAKRQCTSCGEAAFVADSEEYWDEASPEAWRCVECGSTQTNVGVGFALYSDEDGGIRWIYVGVRCADCGVLGCFAGWKVGTTDMSLLDRA